MLKKQLGWISTLVIFAVVALPTSALANKIYAGWIDVWDDGNGKCLNEKVNMDHGENGNGYWYTETYAEKIMNTPFGPVHCQQEWDRPAGYLRAKVIVLKWRGLGLPLLWLTRTVDSVHAA